MAVGFAASLHQDQEYFLLQTVETQERGGPVPLLIPLENQLEAGAL